MQRRFCFAVMAVILFARPASAAMIGNIADSPLLAKGFFTYERPYALAASLEADSIQDRTYRDQVGNFELNAYGTRLGVIIREKVFLYSTLQMGKYKAAKKMAYPLPVVPGRSEVVNRLTVDTDFGFLYGAGISAVMYEHKVNEGVFFRLGLNANYRHVELDTDSAILDHTVFLTLDPTGRTGRVLTDATYKIRLEEYLGALELSYQVDHFTPYLGFFIMESRGKETVNVPGDSFYDYDSDVQLDQVTGFFIGLSYSPVEYASFNLEIRTRAEEAYSAGVLFRF